MMQNSKNSPSNPDPTDEALVAAFYEGDADAFTALYRRHRDLVFGQLRRYLSPEDAEDAMQDVFTKVMEQRWSDQGVPFVHWLSRVARNAALSRCRAHRSDGERRAHLSQVATTTSSQQPDPWTRRILQAALERLHPVKREAWLLREVDGCSYDEIARRQRVPSTTIPGRLHAARRELETLLMEAGVV